MHAINSDLTLESIVAAAATDAGNSDLDANLRAARDATSRGISPIEAFLDNGTIDDPLLLRALATRLQMKFMEETEIDLSEPLHHKFPAKLALRHRLLPGRIDGDEITLLTYDPFDLDAKQAVGAELTNPIHWAIAPRHQIIEGLRKGYGVGAENFDELIEERSELLGDDEMRQEVTVLDEEDEDATVLNFVNQVFREALKERATDIHVEPLEHDLRIRYRVDGGLQEVTVPPNMRVLQSSLISRLKIMADLDIAERRLPQDGRINLELDGSPIDVRVATIPSVNGESVSLRLLRREKFDFDKLGFEPDLAAQIRELLALPNGIILVTGPTGSGKSTTLYSFLRELNNDDTRIVTIEDPVENKLDGIVQIAVKPEIDLSFANGLRSILRGDPNIIMVGEMRDHETAEIAIRGALTGHLVFSTLHTNDAIGGISRLLDMGIEPFLVSSSVRAFLAQRLVRTLCHHCSTPSGDQYTPAYLDEIGFPTENRSGIKKAVGCRECRGSGFLGRMSIVEICHITPAIGDLITSGANASTIKPAAVNSGMVPMRDYGWKKVAKGLTTIEEVLTATSLDT